MRVPDEKCVMQYDHFVGQVQHRAHLASQGEAVAAIRATIETLAERLTGTETADLLAQLPKEIAALVPPSSLIGQEAFPLDEFFARVSAREGVDLPKAVHHARVVAEVLREAVSAGEIQDVLAQLPKEYLPLFEGSSGKMQVQEGGKKKRQSKTE